MPCGLTEPLISGIEYQVFRISAVLAQLVEHITRNDEVVGSIPTNGSRSKGLRDIPQAFFDCIYSFLLFGPLLGIDDYYPEI